MDDINLHAGYRQGYADGRKDSERLAKQNEIMREALKYYANISHWDCDGDDRYTRLDADYPQFDGFDVAAKALKAANDVSESEK